MYVDDVNEIEDNDNNIITNVHNKIEFVSNTNICKINYNNERSGDNNNEFLFQ